jgi:hypothetical protein
MSAAAMMRGSISSRELQGGQRLQRTAREKEAEFLLMHAAVIAQRCRQLKNGAAGAGGRVVCAGAAAGAAAGGGGREADSGPLEGVTNYIKPKFGSKPQIIDISYFSSFTLMFSYKSSTDP